MSLIQSLERAAESGIIAGAEFLIPVFEWEPPGISAEISNIVDFLPPTPPIEPFPVNQQWDDPAWDTRAQRYQDRGFFRNFPIGATDDTVYEIARFDANKGECGFVKYIGTYVQIVDGGGTPVELDFSNPFTIQDAGVGVRFLLRYQPGTPTILGLDPWTGTPPQVPGYGYPELPYWTDYRFYWGRYANHVWFLVPKHHSLRLFIHFTSGADLVRRALGRLQGYTQPIHTLGAEYNVKHGW